MRTTSGFWSVEEVRRDFVANVSHELKTPLTSIRGYAEALEEGVVTPAEGGRVIASEADRLERVVESADRFDPAAAQRVSQGRRYVSREGGQVQRRHGDSPREPDRARVLHAVAGLNLMNVSPYFHRSR